MNIPDGLLEEAKARAALEGSTVTGLVVEGLRARLAAPGVEAGTTITLPSRRLGRSAVDLSDNRSVLDLLDSDEDAAFRDHS